MLCPTCYVGALEFWDQPLPGVEDRSQPCEKVRKTSFLCTFQDETLYPCWVKTKFEP